MEGTKRSMFWEIAIPILVVVAYVALQKWIFAGLRHPNLNVRKLFGRTARFRKD